MTAPPTYAIPATFLGVDRRSPGSRTGSGSRRGRDAAAPPGERGGGGAGEERGRGPAHAGERHGDDPAVRGEARGHAASKQMFAFSILYLFALFATLLAEVVVRAVLPVVW